MTVIWILLLPILPDIVLVHNGYNGFEANTTLEQLRQLQECWVLERNWTQFHTPRNLVLALVGEVGELAELFQWRGEVACSLPGWSDKR